MDLKVINCILAEHLRPEPGGKITAIGIPFVIQLPDTTKPCYPLFCLLQLQGTDSGEAEVSLVIRDTAEKKDVAQFGNKVKIAPHKGETAEVKISGGKAVTSPAGPKRTYNIIQIQPLRRVVFGHPGEFEVMVAVDKVAKKTFKLAVAEAKPQNPPRAQF
ncbi:MAG: hypothetical protein WC901_05045 [Candidatus Margulisiibacteriota bacterium]